MSKTESVHEAMVRLDKSKPRHMCERDQCRMLQAIYGPFDKETQELGIRVWNEYMRQVLPELFRPIP